MRELDAVLHRALDKSKLLECTVAIDWPLVGMDESLKVWLRSVNEMRAILGVKIIESMALGEEEWMLVSMKSCISL